MAKKKRSLQELFMNNKFALVFSIFAAVIIWIAASLTAGTEETRIIENVKVTVDRNEESGYQIFGYEDTFVDVTVKGRKYQISPGALSADDISVVAKSNYVDYSGYQTLTLSASVTGSSDVTITNISETTIRVFYDTPKTAEFSVKANLESESEIVPEGYISEEPISSVSTVKVSGPATEINRISGIEAKAKLNYALTETTAIQAELIALTDKGAAPRYISFDAEAVTVTVPVSKVEELPISVRYLNVPKSYENKMPEVNIVPKSVKVAAAQSVLDEMESLIIGTVDFSNLKNTNNKFTFSLDEIEEVRIIDGTKKVRVSVNCYPMDSKKSDVPAENITILNLPDNLNAELLSKKISSVTLIGPKADLDKINEEAQLSAKIDLKSASVGDGTYKAEVYIKNSDTCWAYGSYKVKVRISEK